MEVSNGASVLNFALNEIDTGNHVKVKRFSNNKYKISSMGGSLGGGMTLRTAKDYQLLNIPRYDAIVCVVPGAGGISFTDIDPSTKVLVISAENDSLNGPASSNNSHQEVWDSLYHIPCVNKNYILVKSDTHGLPKLNAIHNFGQTGNDLNDSTLLNNLDFQLWKWSVSLLTCTYENIDCYLCLGNDPLITDMSKWSDSTSVNQAQLLDSCPTVSVEKLSFETDDIKMYPNPAFNTINFQGLDHSQIHYQIFDLKGRVMLDGLLTQPSLNVEALEKGFYVMRLIKDGNLITTSFRKM